MEKYTIEISREEAINIMEMVDVALRAKGIEALPVANHWQQKLQSIINQKSGKNDYAEKTKSTQKERIS